MSVRFLADENFNRAIVNGVLRLAPEADIVRVQDVGLRTLDDPTILEWAAKEGRVMLSHDAATMPDFAHSRVAAGRPMAGVFIAPATMPVGTVIADLVVVAQASANADWEGRVSYLPLYPSVRVMRCLASDSARTPFGSVAPAAGSRSGSCQGPHACRLGWIA